MTQQNSSTPTWYRDVPLRAVFPKLTASDDANVVVIGGGLTGILSAYLLAKAGKRVVLLEKRTIGSGASGRTTGFLTQSLDTALADLIWMRGQKQTKLVVESHGEAIRLIEKIVRDEQIDCEFMRCDNTTFAEVGKERDAKALAHELIVARSLGLTASVEPERALPFGNAGSLTIKHQAKFHPVKFLAGLALAAQKAGVVIHEHAEASSMETNEQGVTVHVGNERVKAQWALSATYEPFVEPWGLYFKKSLYLDTVMELEMSKDSLPEATFENTENPYHYFRVDRLAFDRVIIGGESHRKDIPVSKNTDFAALEAYITKIFPHLSYKVVTRWQGATLEPIDGLAFIGPYRSERTWYAFGFSGNGMTYAAIAAMMFCDAVIGKENPWREVYDVGRIPRARSLWIKGRDFSGEFVHGALKNIFTNRRV